MNRSGRSVVIVGGTGFIGLHATSEFVRRGWRVTAVGLEPEPPPGSVPDGVRVVTADFGRMTDDAVAALLDRADAAVFAAGADDRTLARRPALEFFRTANVGPTERFFRLCARAGIRRGVLLGSYFVHFVESWPELALAQHHPYIRSRVEQEEAALAAAGPGFAVAVLRLPYIFGSVPGRRPLWAPLVRYLAATPVAFYPRGGSNCVAVERVAEAIVGAAAGPAPSGRYLVGDENLTWVELLGRLMAALGRRRPIVTLPDWTLVPALWCARLLHRLRGRESGLDPVALVRLQTAQTFFDPAPAQQALGFSGGGLDAGIASTVRACR